MDTGRTAYEAFYRPVKTSYVSWDDLQEEEKDRWRDVEEAVRIDHLLTDRGAGTGGELPVMYDAHRDNPGRSRYRSE